MSAGGRAEPRRIVPVATLPDDHREVVKAKLMAAEVERLTVAWVAELKAKRAQKGRAK